jgi:ABC-type multidrug transport system fused ATPase/permease subunit
MKFFNLSLAGFFILFAVVQLNDPDPLFWTTVYGVMALVSVLAAFKKYNIWLMLAILAVLIFELFRLFPSISAWVDQGMPSIVESMKAEDPHIEFVREFLGLFICLITLLFHYFTFRKMGLQASAEN